MALRKVREGDGLCYETLPAGMDQAMSFRNIDVAPCCDWE
jgi:hypothetical protein